MGIYRTKLCIEFQRTLAWGRRELNPPQGQIYNPPRVTRAASASPSCRSFPAVIRGPNGVEYEFMTKLRLASHDALFMDLYTF